MIEGIIITVRDDGGAKIVEAVLVLSSTSSFYLTLILTFARYRTKMKWQNDENMI